MRDLMMRADTIRHMPRQYNVLAPGATRRRSLTYPDTRRYHNDTSAHEAVKFNDRVHPPASSDVSLKMDVARRRVQRIVGHAGVAASRSCAELWSLSRCGVTVFGVTA